MSLIFDNSSSVKLLTLLLASRAASLHICLALVAPIPYTYVKATSILLPLGIFTINRSISKDDPDPHHVVFDEWVGMYIPIVILEYNLFAFILAFFIFRFFDIFKPYPINKFEDLPKAYGVLGDDIVAGVFTLIFVIIIESFIELPVI